MEVKAAAIELNNSHLRQTLNYGANQGVEWLVLTNGIDWQLHKVIFGQPIDKEEIARFNLHTVSVNRDEDLQTLFLLARDGLVSDAINTFHQRAQLLNKFNLTQFLFSDSVLTAIRREMRRLFPDLKVTTEQLQELLCNDVLKREVVEGDKAKVAQSYIKRAASRLAKQIVKQSEGKASEKPASDTTSQAED